MTSPSFPLRRSPRFEKAGRITWIEKTADLLGVNRWFTRRPALVLAEEPGILVSPAHSKVETLARIGPRGEIEEKRVLGGRRSFLLRDILKDEALVERFAGGDFLKLYLAPWDLHFLLFPCGGTLLDYRYRPGYAVPLLFMKSGDVLNERLCVTLQTEFGFPLVFVMIGSFMVNGIHHGFVGEGPYQRGQDLGTFKIGSSVVMAVPPGCVEWLVKEGDKLTLGCPLAKVVVENTSVGPDSRSG
jgi:phosphatidylserine decarboxylase